MRISDWSSDVCSSDLPGRVDVGTDQGAASTNTVATLNIDAGVVIFASTGNAYLAVNRGNKINAVGTSTQPIIFTSEANVKGDSTDQSSGQWGGVVLLGRAKITACGAPAAAPGPPACALRRASRRERVCPDRLLPDVAGSLQKKKNK